MSDERKQSVFPKHLQRNLGERDRGYERINRGRARRGFSWSEIDPDDLGKFVQFVTSKGLAVILGVTSDGGAGSVTILDGDKRLREWPSSKNDFDELYTALVDTYGANQ